MFVLPSEEHQAGGVYRSEAADAVCSPAHVVQVPDDQVYVFAVRVSSVSVSTSRSAAAGGVCFPLRYVPPH